MVCTTWNKPITNIQKDTELFALLQDVNRRVSNELFIERYTVDIKKGLFRKSEEVEYYNIYWEVGCEYQIIMTSEELNRTSVIAYLLGILTGLDKQECKENK